MNALAGISEDQRDCLQEIINVAMGQAGDSLARFLDVFVDLPIPRIRIVDANLLPQALQDMAGQKDSISAVRQGFYNLDDVSGVRGEALVVFNQVSFQALGELLGVDTNDPNFLGSQQDDIGYLLDIANILCGACLNGIAKQLAFELAYSAPSLLGHQVNAKSLLSGADFLWDKALMVEINYRLENCDVSCDLLLLMPDGALEVLKHALDELLEDF